MDLKIDSPSYPNLLEGLRLQNKALNHQERAMGKPVLSSWPLVAKIEITTHCNLRCTMCSVSYRQKSEKGAHLDLDLFFKLKPLFPYLISTYLYGIGEPLLHPHSMEMFQALSAEGVNVGFLTNGILITESRARTWIDEGLYKLSVSIDGATKQIYEAIRRRADFDRLLSNLECVAELKKAKGARFPILTFNFVTMRDNLHELPLLIELASRFGVEELVVTHVIPFVPEMVAQSLAYDDPWVDAIYQQAERLAREYRIKLFLPNPYLRLREQRAAEMNQEPSCDEGQSCSFRQMPTAAGTSAEQQPRLEPFPFASCTEPWSGFWLSQQGFVDPCCYWFEKMGDLREQSFFEIWNNARYQDLRLSVNDPVKRHAHCRKCPVPVS